MRAVRRLAVVAMAVAAMTGLPSASAAPSTTPSHDAFYTYSGQTPLAHIAPGTVLKTRSVQVALGPMSTPMNAEQLLYRTTDELGHPAVTVTTVIAPTPSTLVPRIVGYLSFYDGLDSRCDPSYTLAGGDPGTQSSQQQAVEEGLLISWYVTHGFVVTVPDFEGTQLHWMAGRESGYGTIDSIRATESYLKFAPSTPVGLSGYSGGALAADFASELAPSYAPQLNLVGVAEAGIPVDDAHLFRYINGTTVYSAAMPGILIGIARAYGVNLTPYLSAYGQQVFDSEQHVCINEVFSKYPGLTMQKMMKPQYAEMLHVPVIADMLNRQIMGSVPGHPQVPLFMANGNTDGRGDGVMDAGDVRTLAREYCAQGVPVQYQEYQGAEHESAGIFFEPQTAEFFQERFAGVPAQNNCSSIATGNSLAPEPSRSGSPRTSGQHGATAVGVRGERIPRTGLPTTVPMAALVLLVVAVMLRKRADIARLTN